MLENATQEWRLGPGGVWSTDSIAPPCISEPCAQHIVSHPHTRFVRHVDLHKKSNLVRSTAFATPNRKSGILDFSCFDVLYINILLLNRSLDSCQICYSLADIHIPRMTLGIAPPSGIRKNGCFTHLGCMVPKLLIGFVSDLWQWLLMVAFSTRFSLVKMNS